MLVHCYFFEHLIIFFSEHPFISCHVCSSPVTGTRYKCLECSNYDLCAICERRGVHGDHLMIRIPLSFFKAQVNSNFWSKSNFKTFAPVEISCNFFRQKIEPIEQGRKKRSILKFPCFKPNVLETNRICSKGSEGFKPDVVNRQTLRLSYFCSRHFRIF